MNQKSHKKSVIKTVLPMIAYTSGFLHVGHARSYTACDSLHRWIKQKAGKSFCPFGYDAHGLPTEIKAREQGLNPLIWTEDCILKMEKVIKDMRFDFSDIRLNTSVPNYYLMQQKIFIKLYEKGILYRRKGFVYWDPVAETTLANEQVIDGKADRTGAEVQEKEMEQWFFKLSSYSQELQEALDLLDWSDSIKNAQKSWINWCKWYLIELGPGLILKFSSKIEKISYLEANLNYLNKENLKIELLGLEFNLNHNKDLEPGLILGKLSKTKGIFVRELLTNFSYREEISSNLRDWCISRQRSFGCPIPAAYCSKCGLVVDEKLVTVSPVTKESFKKLSEFSSWININCPICGGISKRETDTLDVLFDSSWYPYWYNMNGQASLPIDYYIGGREHANGHLIYVRAMFKAMNDAGFEVPREPINKFRTNGMINNPVYRNSNGEYIYSDSVIFKDSKFYSSDSKEEVYEGEIEKMSKSKKNVIRLDKLLKNYSSDEIRIAISSDYPLDRDYKWSFKKMQGVRKNLRRINQYLSEGDFIIEEGATEEIDSLYERLAFNKIIAYAYSILNTPNSKSNRNRLAYAIFPIAPGIS